MSVCPVCESCGTLYVSERPVGTMRYQLVKSEKEPEAGPGARHVSKRQFGDHWHALVEFSSSVRDSHTKSLNPGCEVFKVAYENVSSLREHFECPPEYNEVGDRTSLWYYEATRAQAATRALLTFGDADVSYVQMDSSGQVHACDPNRCIVLGVAAFDGKIARRRGGELLRSLLTTADSIKLSDGSVVRWAPERVLVHSSINPFSSEDGFGWERGVTVVEQAPEICLYHPDEERPCKVCSPFCHLHPREYKPCKCCSKPEKHPSLCVTVNCRHRRMGMSDYCHSCTGQRRRNALNEEYMKTEQTLIERYLAANGSVDGYVPMKRPDEVVVFEEIESYVRGEIARSDEYLKENGSMAGYVPLERPSIPVLPPRRIPKIRKVQDACQE